MFKITLTAAAFTLIAGLSHATPIPFDLPQNTTAVTPVAQETAQFEDVAYYCEWATVYDYWGNWITVWQCY
ncbi:hypothetical protein [Pararhodobacter sp.]|uniref:hypothetical protein n=1 Tax=Pararhodobacter sp. TaxID=2127056 RepID=UPI002AFDE895|nr:hypothetical protein [Pararhodobacter sp.]